MKRLHCITILAVVVPCSIVRAGPVLLVSLEETSGVTIYGTGPPPEPRVQFVLELAPQLGAIGPRVGLGVFWEDGDSGMIDFNSETDSGFEGFAELATNNVDDVLTDLIIFPSGGGGGAGAPESWRLGTSPDLFGYQLDYLRLIVQDLTIEDFSPEDQPDLQGISVLAHLRYEFYGTVIAEPTSVALLASGMLTLCYRKRRWLSSRKGKRDTKTVAIMGILASMGSTLAWADQSTVQDGPKSFYTQFEGGCFGCKPRSSAATFTHLGLTDATGNVAFSVRSWGNFNNSAYVLVSVGGTLIGPGNATCNPSNCHFFENGSDSGFGPAPNNIATFTVSGTFFNSKLNGGSTLTVLHALVGPNTCISTVNPPCSTPNSDGDQTSVITWTPAPSCNPPCTDFACQFRECQSGSCVVTGNRPSGTSCGSSSNTQCTDPDTCDGFGNCQSNHEPSGTPCGNATNDQCTNPDTCDRAVRANTRQVNVCGKLQQLC